MKLICKIKTAVSTAALIGALIAVPIVRAQAASIPAFPSCEGFGCETPGGRGGKVMFVTNLNDAGPGSLREALLMTEPRIIVFEVSGTIYLKSTLDLGADQSYVTVNGQSAPGDGIAIANFPLRLSTNHSGTRSEPPGVFHDGVFRHLRFRLGEGGGLDTSIADTLDIFSGSHHIVFDHCSFTWAFDENISTYGSNIHDITFQWNIFAEGAVFKDHPDAKQGSGHNLGPLFAGGFPHDRVTLHHNYLAHMWYRNYMVETGTYDFINNVNYNTFNFDYNFSQTAKTGPENSPDIINHYFKEGPDTARHKPFDLVRWQSEGANSPIRLYLSGNKYVDTRENAVYDVNDQWSMVQFRGIRGDNPIYEERSSPHTTQPVFPVTKQSADESKDLVIAKAGARLPKLDEVDTRLLGDFFDGGGYDLNNIGKYPDLQTYNVPTDTDHDGMPDDWENSHGLNPNDGTDHNKDIDGDGYTNIEEWIHSIGGDPPPSSTNDCTIIIAQDGSGDYTHIQDAANNVRPGDVVCVQDGVYTDTDNNDWIVLSQIDGTSDNWITFRSVNKWGAVLDGEGHTQYGWGQYGNYTRLENFDLTNLGTPSGRGNGFFSNRDPGTKFVEIVGWHFHDTLLCSESAQGLNAAFTGGRTSNFTFDSNVFHDWGYLDEGENGCHHTSNQYERKGINIYMNGSHHKVINNIFYNPHGPWFVMLSTYMPIDDIQVVGNTFVGTFPYRSGHILLEGYDGIVASNILIQNNIFYQPRDWAVHLWPEDRIIGVHKNVIVRNNLVYDAAVINPDYAKHSASEFTIENNITGADPLFVDVVNYDLHLQSTSPAIDEGMATNAPSSDHDGNKRPSGSGYDIGAYEYEDGDVNPQPQCSDGIDNDNDGLIDLGDPGCVGAGDNNEYNSPPSTGNSIGSMKTLTPVIMDGMPAEEIWSHAKSVTFSNHSRSDNLVKVSTLWDNNYLYFAYEVTDQHLEAQNQQVWKDDGAEIFLDSQNNKSTSTDSNDFHFMININDLSDPAGIDVRTVTKTDGYTMEIAIPWDLINTTPEQGKVMGLLLGNNDRDNGNSVQFDWLDLIETGSYARPNLWGEVVLSGETGAACDGDLNGDERIDVADLQLLVNIVLGAYFSDICADLNSDGIVNVIDLQVIINWILGA